MSLNIFLDDDDNTHNTPVDHVDVAPATADGPSARRDHIAQEMWEDYLAVHLERGLSDE